MRKKLVGFPAGECAPSEQQAIRRHLEDCPGCAREMQNLQSLDLLLDLLEPEVPPEGLADSIMAEIAGATGQKVPMRSNSHKKTAGSSLGLLKDITVAAAAALAVFWIGGSVMGPVASSAGGKISGAVTSYVHFTGVAVSRTSQAVSDINQDLFYNAGKLSLPKYETGK